MRCEDLKEVIELKKDEFPSMGMARKTVQAIAEKLEKNLGRPPTQKEIILELERIFEKLAEKRLKREAI